MSRLNVANFRHPDATADNINLNSSGNVGVGASSPEELLHLSSASPKIKLTDTTTGADHLLDGDSGVGTFWVKVDDNAEGSNPAFIVDVAGTERVRVTSTGDLQFNSGYGSVVAAYGVRAWVNFNGTGTPAIRTSGNCSSITDNGTGYYTVNFTTAMPDTNYAAIGTSEYRHTVQTDEGTRTTSSVTVSTSIGASGTSLVSHTDKSIVQLVVVR